jgi:predicted O-methyltransferase YrrM
VGFRTLSSVAQADPQLVVEALGPRVNRSARLSTVRSWPDALLGFEDLAFLFSSHQLHHAVISMAIDEAAYIFALARSLPGVTVAEIGRSKGGSTLLLAVAVAVDEDSHVWSYDLHVKPTAGKQSDAELLAVLDRYDLADRVTLVVGDSRVAEAPPQACDLVLIDGDHSYEGARADYERWRRLVRPGGHMLFHDAVELGELSVAHEGVARLISEIEREGELVRSGGTGTLAHFQLR